MNTLLTRHYAQFLVNLAGSVGQMWGSGHADFGGVPVAVNFPSRRRRGPNGARGPGHRADLGEREEPRDLIVWERVNQFVRFGPISIGASSASCPPYPIPCSTSLREICQL